MQLLLRVFAAAEMRDGLAAVKLFLSMQNCLAFTEATKVKLSLQRARLQPRMCFRRYAKMDFAATNVCNCKRPTMISRHYKNFFLARTCYSCRRSAVMPRASSMPFTATKFMQLQATGNDTVCRKHAARNDKMLQLRASGNDTVCCEHAL